MFEFRGKKYQLDKLKVMYKFFTPVVTFFLALLPIIGLFPKIPLLAYFIVCVLFLIMNIYILMIQWDKDTEIYRLKHRFADAFLNKITTIEIYTISMFIFLCFFCGIVCFMPNHLYAQKHLDELSDYVATNDEIDLNTVYINKTDSVPLSQLTKSEIDKLIDKNGDTFFCYVKTEKTSLINQELAYSYAKIICQIDKDSSDKKNFVAKSKYCLGSISSSTQYIVLDIPYSDFK